MNFAGAALPLAAGVALLVFLIRLAREPRRLGNAVWLGVALLLTGAWLLREALHLEWLTPIVAVLLAAIAVIVALVLPAALIFNGAQMWRKEGRSKGNLLSLALGVGLITLEVLFFVPLGRWGTALVAIAIVLTSYFGFLLTSLLVYSVLYSRVGRHRDVEAIIVLGCGLAGDRVPPLLAGRLDRAIRLYEREPAHPPLLVVSGGKGPGESVTEADAMHGYLRERGVPEDRIRREDQATTTEENLRFSAALLPQSDRAGRVLAVTSNYHVFRTAVECRRLGLPIHATGSPTARYFLPSALLREFAALILHYRRTTIAACVLITGAGVALAVV
ncbi:YdcF family protein [Amycolatopsis sp. WQ 127309]|uniref:YdcF family protein n=1 Tax=Amycolatopsis sp. WQ 127309 TaxID=2932773 RepID=UPI001FF6A4DA|nr:YdcF family protein [Amycolatopsis sp. WQ 127309]UOZ04090.1 YdcF family protein [Amycolatopsis sp. WQ 127309]